MRLSITLLLCILSLTCYSQAWNDDIDIRITPGIDFAHLTISNSPETSKRNLRIGGEIEFILPMNDRHWGVVAEPAYQSFYAPEIDFNYESVEVSIGLRHHFFINDNA
ncbi:MAG TPA: hypothetical protein VFE50_19480, partial [Cyclobacteriaceae bacterium]|nr:hypothetical protein [Cyclobacteriaceae bacterium]